MIAIFNCLCFGNSCSCDTLSLCALSKLLIHLLDNLLADCDMFLNVIPGN